MEDSCYSGGEQGVLAFILRTRLFMLRKHDIIQAFMRIVEFFLAVLKRGLLVSGCDKRYLGSPLRLAASSFSPDRRSSTNDL